MKGIALSGFLGACYGIMVALRAPPFTLALIRNSTHKRACCQALPEGCDNRLFCVLA